MEQAYDTDGRAVAHPEATAYALAAMPAETVAKLAAVLKAAAISARAANIKVAFVHDRLPLPLCLELEAACKNIDEAPRRLEALAQRMMEAV